MAPRLILPPGYRPYLDLRTTLKALTTVRDLFLRTLTGALSLQTVPAPPAPADLWTHQALADYGFQPGEGILAECSRTVPEVPVDNLHSPLEDGWTWERLLPPEQATDDTLHAAAATLYAVIRKVEHLTCLAFPALPAPYLPQTLEIVRPLDLDKTWPDLAPTERHTRICQEKKAALLANDLFVWYPPLRCAIDLGLIGLRAAPASPPMSPHGTPQSRHGPSLHGTISRSRLFLLRKAHLGEVQPAPWPDDVLQTCRDNAVPLL